MAKAKVKTSTSVAIRDALTANPGGAAAEVAKELGVSPNMVHNVKAKMKKKAKGTRDRKSGGKVVRHVHLPANAALDSAFEFVTKVGGLIHAERLIATLKAIKGTVHVPDASMPMNIQKTLDFFQHESGPALRSQAKWLDENLGLDASFLSRCLNVDEEKIEQWQKAEVAALPPAAERVFRELWYVILHLLSHYDNDESQVRRLFEQSAPSTAKRPSSPLVPPWFGSSLKSHLESCGSRAIKDLNDWVMAFRFGDPYSASS